MLNDPKYDIIYHRNKQQIEARAVLSKPVQTDDATLSELHTHLVQLNSKMRVAKIYTENSPNASQNTVGAITVSLTMPKFDDSSDQERKMQSELKDAVNQIVLPTLNPILSRLKGD